jgi:hypothetical protein
MNGVIIENERLAAAVTSLVDIFRHEQHTPKAEERKALERLLAKLKGARNIANELAQNDRQRIFCNPVEPTALLDLIRATQAAISDPLPGKAKQENLYNAMVFQYRLITGKPATISRTDTPNLFQKFMAVIVCCIDDAPASDWGDYVERTTQHYNRVILKQKK